MDHVFTHNIRGDRIYYRNCRQMSAWNLNETTRTIAVFRK